MEGQLLSQQTTVHRPRVPYTPLSPASTTSPSAWNLRRAFKTESSTARTQRQNRTYRHCKLRTCLCSAVAAEAAPQTFGDGAVAKVIHSVYAKGTQYEKSNHKAKLCLSGAN